MFLIKLTSCEPQSLKYRVYEEDTASLACDVFRPEENNTSYRCDWTKDDFLISKEGIVNSKDCALIITNISRSDKGIYQCQTTDRMKGNKYDLDVLFPPGTPTLNVPKVVEEGDVIQVTCKSENSNPRSSLNIFVNSEMVKNSRTFDGYYDEEDTSVVTLKLNLWLDSGDYEIRCLANSSSAFVISEPSWITVLDTRSEIVKVESGVQEIKIHCEVTSDWYAGGHFLKKSKEFTVKIYDGVKIPKHKCKNKNMTKIFTFESSNNVLPANSVIKKMAGKMLTIFVVAASLIFI